MSLEVAIQENTAAIRDLIAAIASGAAVPAAADKVVAASTKSKTEAKQEAVPPVANTEAAEEGAPAVTYNEAASVITKLSRAKGRDAALKVLQGFGADNLKGIKPEQFADVMGAAQKALEA
ncbi:hypothetical protein JK151_08970 [Ralstonia syzygii subsp. celebesensis]|uniref:Uncharacterized protein n=2 Tax=Ralstonia syzygii subsp. celebesensis TaxID=1310168 RepID=A0A1U9VFZ1_9RALS|nr:hypothetical protein [Ralstonia syzygii]AQW29107.1 hypothetical protein B0B51_03155 [blood disease bacterium A2-HR MARDI]QQV54350.1 hypothetical protein JK151_08970 [Ralstonia syzygii subsp. celebesensis]CCA79396.1 putative phage protein p35 [blood disease bacterium R229]